MKPIETIATAKTPDGQDMLLKKRDQDYVITIDGRELMTSRQHESELELARLGCKRLEKHRNPVVLIGGLGMGYTLRAALDLLAPGATVIVCELLPEIVAWNREHIGHLANHPLTDRRVQLHVGDVERLINELPDRVDALMLDVDNGPDAMVSSTNGRLYTAQGIRTCMRALHHKGVLSIWSNRRENSFERRVTNQRLHIHFFKVPAYKGGRALSRCIYTLSRERKSLPAFTQRSLDPRKGKRGDKSS